jgi:hypothetical protein
MLTGEALQAAQSELDGENAEIKFAVSRCRYCKVAKKRGKTECKKHSLAFHLAYVCSPVSETYWSS